MSSKLTAKSKPQNGESHKSQETAALHMLDIRTQETQNDVAATGEGILRTAEAELLRTLYENKAIRRENAWQANKLSLCRASRTDR